MREPLTGGLNPGDQRRRTKFATKSPTIYTSEVCIQHTRLRSYLLDTNKHYTERVYLLNHILNMVIEPKHAQHPDIQKLNLNVKKLEEITLDALSGFFADKENPGNNRKKPYLTEIFKVARQQERFKNDEIGKLGPTPSILQKHALTVV